MLEATGTLRDPETVQVHLIFNNQERWIRGYEAITFLLVRDYIEYVNVNGQLRLVTTPKYKAWKNSRTSVTPPPNSGPGSTPMSGMGVTFSGGLDPVEVTKEMNEARANGYLVSYDGVTISISVASTQPGSPATISPQKLVMVRHQTSVRDGSKYEKTSTMDLGIGTVVSDSFVKGHITNILVTYTSIPGPGNLGMPPGVRNTGDPDCDWSATRDNQGVWHLSVAEAPHFLLH
ncbi:MAG: hypothetical protein ACLP1Y_13580 [Candidatus Acidiferrales bacterium]